MSSVENDLRRAIRPPLHVDWVDGDVSTKVSITILYNYTNILMNIYVEFEIFDAFVLCGGVVCLCSDKIIL